MSNLQIVETEIGDEALSMVLSSCEHHHVDHEKIYLKKSSPLVEH